jgi:hypothetical protein
MGISPSSLKDGDIRDELAEKLHKKKVSFEQIRDEIYILVFE